MSQNDSRQQIMEDSGITPETEFGEIMREQVDGGVSLCFAIDVVELERILRHVPDNIQRQYRPYLIRMHIPEGGSQPPGDTTLHDCKDFKRAMKSFESYKLTMTTVDLM